MATNPVNLVDAVAEIVPRIAKERTATLRTGKVASVTGGVAKVNIGGSTTTISARFHTYYTPVVGDVVSLITQRDVWLILGKLKA
jgi:hypothetical protein